jgi:hypothetical protein
MIILCTKDFYLIHVLIPLSIRKCLFLPPTVFVSRLSLLTSCTPIKFNFFVKRSLETLIRTDYLLLIYESPYPYSVA